MLKNRKIPFIPTIFEHSAKIINKTPSEAALDGKLLEEAQVQSYLLYKHDAVTVGVDVYNIEAEALGCKIKFHNDNSIPGVISHPFSEEYDLETVLFSTDKGRIRMILNAAERVKERIGNYVNIGIGISGIFSICVELTGFEKLMMDYMDNEKTVHLLLEKTLEFQKDYCKEIIRRGLGITIFESWAAPPLISPTIYKNLVMPYEKELISYIKDQGITYVPLVIGGDTSSILDDMLETGTSLLISDYKADISYFIDKAKEKNMTIRGNIDPKLVEKGPKEEIIKQLENMLEKVKDYDKFVVGTGVLSYNTPSENIIAIREYMEKYL